jgi:hypothetical protein
MYQFRTEQQQGIPAVYYQGSSTVLSSFPMKTELEVIVQQQLLLNQKY